ncbi:MAG: sugar phosphate isomerase [Bacteroidetes bacterium]|nr:MAG: sugar phosphate isomerase [Bacteroidota bacterium]
MKQSRRSFIKAGGLLASGAALGSIALKSLAKGSSFDNLFHDSATLKEFGLQLYTLRADLPKDPKAVLKQVSEFGYKQLEGFEGGKGMFWGMTNKEFDSYVSSLGMKMISSHCDINKDFDRKAAEAAEIGMKYLICPYVGPQKTADDYKKIADKFNEKGDICKKNGIRFGYHNHNYSFNKLGDVYPQDIFMQNTNPDTVDYEMDIYWVVAAGQDPIEWLNKYPNRWRLCHIKDRQKGADPKNFDASVDLGTGSIDFAKIVKTASSKGMKYYIVEQEKYEGTTPLKSAEADAAYLKTFKY